MSELNLTSNVHEQMHNDASFVHTKQIPINASCAYERMPNNASHAREQKQNDTSCTYEQMLNDALYVYAKQILGILCDRGILTDNEELLISTLVAERYPSSMRNVYSGRAYLSCQGYGEICKTKRNRTSDSSLKAIRQSNEDCA